MSSNFFCRRAAYAATAALHPDAPTPVPADPASPRKAKAKRRRKQPDGAADPPVGEDGRPGAPSARIAQVDFAAVNAV